MKLYDTHVHSTFSTDSRLTMKDACDKAISLGLGGIAFTDHLDVHYTGHLDEFHYNIDEYFVEYDKIKSMYKGRLEVLSAIEIGIQDGYMEETDRIIDGYRFDYIIGSTHLIDGVDPYNGTYFGSSEMNDSYLRYLNIILKNLNLYQGYDTFGHYDYLVRYAPYEDSTMYYKDYKDILDEILKKVIDKNLAFEINTRSYDKVRMDLNVLKRFRELGGEIVTIGSDAHDAFRVGLNFKYFTAAIEAAGFKYIAYYKNRIPHFITVK